MTIKHFIVSTLLIGSNAYTYQAYAHDVELGYETQNFENVADSTNIQFNSKIFQDSIFEAVYIDMQYKTWELENSRLDPKGLTANVVAYYDLGKEGNLFASTQLQSATSNLFPKATLYHETSYRLGKKKNILLGAGLGYQDYYDRDAEFFYKVGPVYYFEGGAVGYKYGEYLDSGTNSNSLFVDYRFNDHLSTVVRYEFGDGYWDYEYLNIDDTTNVKSSDLDVKVYYDANESLSPYVRLGKIKVEDKDLDETILESTNYGLGLQYTW